MKSHSSRQAKVQVPKAATASIMWVIFSFIWDEIEINPAIWNKMYSALNSLGFLPVDSNQLWPPDSENFRRDKLIELLDAKKPEDEKLALFIEKVLNKKGNLFEIEPELFYDFIKGKSAHWKIIPSLLRLGLPPELKQPEGNHIPLIDLLIQNSLESPTMSLDLFKEIIRLIGSQIAWNQVNTITGISVRIRKLMVMSGNPDPGTSRLGDLFYTTKDLAHLYLGILYKTHGSFSFALHLFEKHLRDMFIHFMHQKRFRLAQAFMDCMVKEKGMEFCKKCFSEEPDYTFKPGYYSGNRYYSNEYLYDGDYINTHSTYRNQYVEIKVLANVSKQKLRNFLEDAAMLMVGDENWLTVWVSNPEKFEKLKELFPALAFRYQKALEWRKFSRTCKLEGKEIPQTLTQIFDRNVDTLDPKKIAKFLLEASGNKNLNSYRPAFFQDFKEYSQHALIISLQNEATEAKDIIPLIADELQNLILSIRSDGFSHYSYEEQRFKSGHGYEDIRYLSTLLFLQTTLRQRMLQPNFLVVPAAAAGIGLQPSADHREPYNGAGPGPSSRH